MEDKRSKKIVVVSHCILNQNAKVEGLSRFPGVITPIVDFLVKSGAGIIQMPCPETTYLGIRRWQHVKEQYDTPAFREHCRKLASSVVDQLEDYQESGYKIMAVLGMNGSPSCGVDRTPRNPTWGGMIPEKLPKQEQVPEKGVYMETLEAEMKRQKLDIPIIGVPEYPEVGVLEEAVSKLRKLLSD